MCGIFGLVYKTPPTRQVLRASRRFFRALSFEALSRGGDAAGFALVDRTGRAWVHKANESVARQLTNGTWDQQLLRLGRHSCAILGHTRAATHGANTVFNAHPHRFEHSEFGGLIGTHNGIISNYAEIYPFTGEAFDNDSANLFAYLAQHSDEKWPKLLSRYIDGWYALAMHRGQRIYFVRNSAPCVFAAVPALGALAYASTDYMLRGAAKESGIFVTDHTDLPACTLVSMSLTGEIVEKIGYTEMIVSRGIDYGAYAPWHKRRNWQARRAWHDETVAAAREDESVPYGGY